MAAGSASIAGSRGDDLGAAPAHALCDEADALRDAHLLLAQKLLTRLR
jgi:hypothetical protein